VFTVCICLHVISVQQKRRDDYNALLTQRDSIIQKINDKKKIKAEQDEKIAVVSLLILFCLNKRVCSVTIVWSFITLDLDF